MKTGIRLVLFLLFAVFSTHLFAQHVTRRLPCVKESFQPQIDSIKQALSSQGFALLREASMTMESDYEMPVIMPLTEGSKYHFVFIGDPTSKSCQVRMYDWAENEVFQKQHIPGEVDAHMINYSYSPQATQHFMIKPVQVNEKQKKGLCGYVMMFIRITGRVQS